MNLSMRAMRLKLSGKLRPGLLPDVSTRKQVGDAEAMLSEEKSGDSERGVGGEKPWWRNVGMEEGM